MSLEIVISHIRVWYFTVSFHIELCEEKNYCVLTMQTLAQHLFFLCIIPHVITIIGNL